MKRSVVDPPSRGFNHGFNLATVVQVGLIPLLTVIFLGIGFYFTVGDTLRLHDSEIRDIQKDRKKVQQEMTEKRETDRNTFLVYQQKTNEILSKLDTRLAVSETKQEVANQTLAKIAEELTKISSNTRR